MKVLVEGEDYYRNRDGFVVLTSRHHLARGYCCGMACKHCPFDFDSVPEPQRSDAIARQATENSKPNNQH
ncbi:MAG: DUF5522 domain-containing protein [Chitinophagaceae bacterium]